MMETAAPARGAMEISATCNSLYIPLAGERRWAKRAEPLQRHFSSRAFEGERRWVKRTEPLQRHFSSRAFEGERLGAQVGIERFC